MPSHSQLETTFHIRPGVLIFRVIKDKHPNHKLATGANTLVTGFCQMH
jgi:hypothetical protein